MDITIKGLNVDQGKVLLQLCDEMKGMENARILLPIYDCVKAAIVEAGNSPQAESALPVEPHAEASP